MLLTSKTFAKDNQKFLLCRQVRVRSKFSNNGKFPISECSFRVMQAALLCQPIEAYGQYS